MAAAAIPCVLCDAPATMTCPLGCDGPVYCSKKCLSNSGYGHSHGKTCLAIRRLQTPHAEAVFSFRIELRDVRAPASPVWREFCVLGCTSIKELCLQLNSVMGWSKPGAREWV